MKKEINKLKEKYQKGNALVLIDVNPEFQFKKAIQY